MYLEINRRRKDAIDKGQVKAALDHPASFRRQCGSAQSANFLMLLDGSDQFAVSSGYSAVGLVAQNFGLQISRKISLSAGVTASTNPSLPITTSGQILYNPDMNDRWFVIPGIIGMILQTLAIEQAAIFMVRDREWGTMEQILATPVRQLELILSKLIPLPACACWHLE